MFKPRPKQLAVLAYRSGYMGVAAVPGSGKTATLSYLTAQLLAETELEESQEILIVTLVNSAVANFARQVNEYVKANGLLPGYGYRVRTLHGLANDIVRGKPSAAGLDDQFSIVDERESNAILAEAVDAWVRRNPEAPAAYLAPQYAENGHYRTQKWAESLTETARSFIRQAKDDLLTSRAVLELLAQNGGDLSLAEFCAEIYSDYERALAYRGAVDFQDLIRLALQVLRDETAYLESLRRKWLYILEDEAQDSSRLQEDILQLLAGPDGNWARVGDPNQAIFETFTTADPKYLRAFIESDGVDGRELPNSGRSTRSIQTLANRLIDWSLAHPQESIRARKPLSKPYIQPTPAGDPQPNPLDDPAALVLVGEAYSATKEGMMVTESCKRWLAQNPYGTAAILVARNTRGSEIVKFLRQKGVPYVENLNSSSSTRAVIGALARVLAYLADAKSAGKLAEVYRVWRRDDRDDPADAAEIKAVSDSLKGLKRVEDLVAPRGEHDWLEDDANDESGAGHYADLRAFRERVGIWLRAAEMPIDQLVLTIAADIFRDMAELATGQMAALHLARLGESHPLMRLPEFAAELYDIAANRRRFTGLGDDEGQFDPDAHKGKVTVTTLHKAKGLEWDRVYLISVNNYDFPSAEPQDSFIGERWYIRDSLNMSAEALAQLASLQQGGAYHEGLASLEARFDYAAERLRLLFVGITRARKALTITWNTGRGTAAEATPLIALRTFWEEERKKEAAREPQR
ncbi:MAG: ATP-dependent helicase [Chloroflexi bacterium]|nr:ATP-dependent helicase [Chloroflexota bacterium]